MMLQVNVGSGSTPLNEQDHRTVEFVLGRHQGLWETDSAVPDMLVVAGTSECGPEPPTALHCRAVRPRQSVVVAQGIALCADPPSLKNAGSRLIGKRRGCLLAVDRLFPH